MKLQKSLYLFLFAYFIFCAKCSKLEAQAIKSGEPWVDTDGELINAHGGGVIFHENTYYWFGEHRGSGKKRFSTWEGVRCYSSPDLINWMNEGIALSVDEDPNSEITSGCNIERPKVIYNEATRKFVMWFHLELKGQGYNAAKTAVAVADKPTGPYVFIQSYRPNAEQWPLNFEEGWKSNTSNPADFEWWTSEWIDEVRKGLFVRRDFEQGQMSRDMTLFVDDDGTAYHIHSSEENLTLHISELTGDYLDFTGQYVVVEPAGHNEAPAVFKRDSTYYMITSGCTGWEPNAARSFKSTSMLGPWTPLGNPCVGKGANRTFESQSTYVLQLNSEDAFIFMADQWNPQDLKQSRYVWLPVEWKNDLPVLQWNASWNLDSIK